MLVLPISIGIPFQIEARRMEKARVADLHRGRPEHMRQLGRTPVRRLSSAVGGGGFGLELRTEWSSDLLSFRRASPLTWLAPAFVFL
jgi:hypothetical protein